MEDTDGVYSGKRKVDGIISRMRRYWGYYSASNYCFPDSGSDRTKGIRNPAYISDLKEIGYCIF